MRSRPFIFSLGALLIVSGNAAAQDPENLPYFNRSDAQAAINRALSTLPKLKCGKEPCAPATTEEFVTPPVELGEAREALIVGAISARLQWCGLDWKKRSYPVLMQQYQQKGIHDTRTLAILSLIHREQFGKDYSSLQALKTCNDELRASLDKQNPVIEFPPWQRTVNNALLDKSVETMLQRVLSEIHKSRCGPGLCVAASDEEKANPPVTIKQARSAMKVGILSGVAEFCGLDWKKRIFFPFMAVHRSRLKMSTRQLTIVSMLHGTMQGFMVQSYQKHEEPCTDKLRNSLERHLSRG